jgi:hypothetical protein
LRDGWCTALAGLARPHACPSWHGGAEVAGRIVLEVDDRHLSSRAGWHLALWVELSADSDALAPLTVSVLLVDSFEAVAGPEGWLREDEPPNDPADMLVVLAGRTPADAAWRLPRLKH